jgi:histidinol dehydrogenase
MKLIRTFGRTAKSAAAHIAAIEARAAASTAQVEAAVSTILADVRHGGDDALIEHAGRFDGLKLDDGTIQPLRVADHEMEAAWHAIPPELQTAMQVARANIRAFAEAQKPEEWTLEADGVVTGQIVRPIAAVGCYVPGGRYPLPSTVFMTVTPAQVAGVPRIVVCSPKPARETLAAVYLASRGSRSTIEFYRIGGAQAVAALAFGTATIRKVDKIVGPGNLYVTAAKAMVSHECGIDMPAGPTEIGVISEKGDPAGIAADLVAQAEHDPEALAVFITSNEALATGVLAEVKLQSRLNPIAKQSLAANGAIFVTRTVAEARELTNRLAFEHLSVDAMSDLDWVTNAGSVFAGRFSPQSMGDYISGPNHVLPTGRAGRIRGGLSVQDFLKVITVQHYSRTGLAALGPHTILLAEAEGLRAHAQSVRVKLGKKGRTR